MITNQNILDTASTAFHAKFDEIFRNGAPGEWQRYTEAITTDTKTNEIDILETMPVVREWVGAKQFKDVLASSLSATIKQYERSFKIKSLDARTDRTGAVGRLISSFMRTSGDIFDKLAFAELVSASGAGGTGYDGVALFATNHPRGAAGGNQSNKSTSALTFSTYETALIAGSSLTDAEGEPLRIAYDTLMVGPKLRKVGMQITGSTERIAGIDTSTAEFGTVVAAATIPNVFGGGAMTLVEDPRLVGTQDDYWYLFDTKRGPKPVIAFVLRDPVAVEQTQLTDEGMFLHGELRFSVEADVVFAPGDWHVAYAGVL